MRARLFALLAFFLIGAVACGTTTRETTTDGGTHAHEAATPEPDAAGCPPSSGLTAYETAASGSITGGGVAAVLCNAAVTVYLSSHTIPANQLLFEVGGVSTTATFDAPAKASDPVLTGQLRVATASPGVFKSSDSQACGGLNFSYSLPIPAGVDCQGMTGPTCPAGCTSACALSCTPCAPQQPEEGFEAEATSDCLGETQTLAGSWTLTLTSVTPSTDSAGYYLVHGSLEATLGPEQDAGSGAAALSLTF